jgi:hypothetical protein
MADVFVVLVDQEAAAKPCVKEIDTTLTKAPVLLSVPWIPTLINLPRSVSILAQKEPILQLARPAWTVGCTAESATARIATFVTKV